jgi:hypothetical protein
MRIRLLPILVLACSCSGKTSLGPGADDAAASDAQPGADARGDDVAPPQKDAEVDATADSWKGSDLAGLAGDLPGRDLGGKDSGSTDRAVDAAVGDLVGDHVDRDGPGAGRGDVATVDGGGEEAGPPCQVVVPAQKGDTVGWMASQCGWTSPQDPGAPVAGIALPGTAEAMSFRLRVDIDPEAYAHEGYVSAPSLAEVGPLSGQGMEVLGPSAGVGQGQYFFDLRWANEVAPREGLRITLTASVSFACSPAMSRTIPATTTAELVLCRSSSGGIVWRAPGETCDTCDAGSPVDAGTDGDHASSPQPWSFRTRRGLSAALTAIGAWTTYGRWPQSRAPSGRFHPKKALPGRGTQARGLRERTGCRMHLANRSGAIASRRQARRNVYALATGPPDRVVAHSKVFVDPWDRCSLRRPCEPEVARFTACGFDLRSCIFFADQDAPLTRRSQVADLPLIDRYVPLNLPRDRAGVAAVEEIEVEEVRVHRGTKGGAASLPEECTITSAVSICGTPRYRRPSLRAVVELVRVCGNRMGIEKVLTTSPTSPRPRGPREG